MTEVRLSCSWPISPRPRLPAEPHRCPIRRPRASCIHNRRRPRRHRPASPRLPPPRCESPLHSTAKRRYLLVVTGRLQRRVPVPVPQLPQRPALQPPAARAGLCLRCSARRSGLSRSAHWIEARPIVRGDVLDTVKTMCDRACRLLHGQLVAEGGRPTRDRQASGRPRHAG